MNRSAILKSILLCGAASAALLFATPPAAAGAKPKKFEPAMFPDEKAIAKQARKFFDDEDLEDIQKAGPRQLVISEFAVDFVAQETKKGSGGILQLAGVGKSVLEFEEDYKKTLPDTLYDGLVKELEAAGFKVVPRDQVVGHELYKEFVGAEDAASASGQTGAMKGAYQHLLVYPPQGMKLLETKGDAEDRNKDVEARLADALGVPLALRVHVKVGLWDREEASIESGSWLLASLTPKKKVNKKTQAVTWEFDSDEKCEMKDGLRVEGSVVTASDFEGGKGKVLSIDTAKFQGALMQMYPTYAKMVAALLKKD